MRGRREGTNWPRALSVIRWSVGGIAATPLLSLRWTFRATGSASVIATHGHAIPTAQATREAVEAGGLMSYGTSLSDMFRRVGVYTGSAAATRRRLRVGLGR